MVLFLGMRLTHSQEELNLPVNQVLASLVRSIRKASKQLVDIQKSALETELRPAPTTDRTGDERALKAASALEKMKRVEITIDVELLEATNEVAHELREKHREMVNSLDLTLPSLLSLRRLGARSTLIPRAGTRSPRSGVGLRRRLCSVKTSVGEKRKLDEIPDEGGGDGKGAKGTARSMKDTKRLYQ